MYDSIRVLKSFFIKQYWPIISISAIALVLRLYRIDYQSTWGDESFSIVVSRMPLDAMMDKLVSDFVQPPLHYLLLHFLPFNDLGHTAERIFSALCGWLAVPISYIAGKTLFDKRTATIAVLLLSISQLGVMYSQEIRPYAQQMLFVSSTLMFYALATNSYKPFYWWGFVLSGVGAMYAHYYSFFLVGALYFRLLFFEKKISLSIIISGVVVSVLLYLPWLSSGFIEAAQHDKKVSGINPEYFKVTPQSIIRVLNDFNNGKYKFVLGKGSELAMLIGMVLFTSPAIVAINRRWFGIGLSAKGEAQYWTVIAFAVSVSSFVSGSSLSLILLSLILILHAARFWILATHFANNAWWLGNRVPWIILMLFCAIAVYVSGARFYLMLTMGLLLGQSIYALLLTPQGLFITPKSTNNHAGHVPYLLIAIVYLAVVVPVHMGIAGVQFTVRYTLAALPVYYLLVAHGISKIDSNFWRKLLLLLVILHSAYALKANYFVPYKENWRDSLKVVAQQYQTNDCIVYMPSAVEPREWQVYGYDVVQPEAKVVAFDEMSTTLPACGRIWLFLYSRVNWDIHKERKRITRNIITNTHKEDRRWSFHWIDLVLYNPRTTKPAL